MSGEFNLYRIARRPKGTDEPFKPTHKQFHLSKENAEFSLKNVQKMDALWDGKGGYQSHDYRIEYQTIYEDDWSEA